MKPAVFMLKWKFNSDKQELWGMRTGFLQEPTRAAA